MGHRPLWVVCLGPSPHARRPAVGCKGVGAGGNHAPSSSRPERVCSAWWPAPRSPTACSSWSPPRSVGAGLLAAPAHAAPTVDEIEAQIDKKWEQLEPTIEQYNKVRAQLKVNRQEVGEPAEEDRAAGAAERAGAQPGRRPRLPLLHLRPVARHRRAAGQRQAGHARRAAHHARPAGRAGAQGGRGRAGRAGQVRRREAEAGRR